MTTRRGLFRMFAAAFAAAKIPILARQTPSDDLAVIASEVKIEAKAGHAEWIEIGKVREVTFDLPELIDVTSHGDAYRRFVPTGNITARIECQEANGGLIGALQSLKTVNVRVDLGREGSVEFAGIITSIEKDNRPLHVPLARLEFQIFNLLNLCPGSIS